MEKEHTNDTDQRHLDGAVISLLRSDLFGKWSGMLMVGNAEIRDDVPTAATDGRNVFYGRQFIRLLDRKMLAFVVMHECEHKTFRHLTVWRKLYEEDHELANKACDYVINLRLVKADPTGSVIAIPRIDGKPIILLDPRFEDMDSHGVFKILKQEKKDNKDSGGQGQPDNSFDDHMWEEAKNLDPAEQKKLDEEIDNAIRQGQMAAAKKGNGQGKIDAQLNDLMYPKINWKDAMRDFVQVNCAGRDESSWSRPNRRFVAQGIYMPSMVGMTVERLSFLIDTSGSVFVTKQVLTEFMSEAIGACHMVKPEKIDIIYWDTKVAAHEIYTAADIDRIKDSTKPVGGGGTNPTCVMDYMRENGIKPDCIVVLTDGEVFGNWGDRWPAPMLWAIKNKREIVAPVGKTVQIKNN